MLISQSISWPATNWPDPNIASSQYTIFQYVVGGSLTEYMTVTSSATNALVSYDDSQNMVFQVRPSSGTTPSLLVGPEVTTVVIGYVPCRAYIRQAVRQSLADNLSNATNTPTWTDDEINKYIHDALNELNLLFPLEEDATIQLQGAADNDIGQAGIRDYALPDDFYLLNSVEYITVDGKLHLFLKEKPFRGGESTATSYIGYPKLGIMLSPLAGRFYPGHYDVYEQQIHIDWDPVNNGDTLHLRYFGKRPLPTSDIDIMQITQGDITLLSLRAQMSCCLRVESQDSRLSRWSDRKRDDLPTLKFSGDIKRLYNELVNDRRELRPKTHRLVRR